jgi:hypothetical protein
MARAEATAAYELGLGANAIAHWPVLNFSQTRGVARDVLTEVLNPGIDASQRASRRRAGGQWRRALPPPASQSRWRRVSLLEWTRSTDRMHS